MNSRKYVCKLAGFLVAVEVITSCVVARADLVKFSGYLQAEILRETGEGSNKTEERVRRARIKMRVKPVDIASVTIQGDFTKKDVSVKDLLCGHLLHTWDEVTGRTVQGAFQFAII